jgi:transposase
VARRRQIVEMMTAERNRRHQMTARKRLKAIERHLDWLQKELSEIEQELDQTIRGTPSGARAKTCSNPCLGSATPSPAP